MCLPAGKQTSTASFFPILELEKTSNLLCRPAHAMYLMGSDLPYTATQLLLRTMTTWREPSGSSCNLFTSSSFALPKALPLIPVPYQRNKTAALTSSCQQMSPLTSMSALTSMLAALHRPQSPMRRQHQGPLPAIYQNHLLQVHLLCSNFCSAWWYMSLNVYELEKPILMLQAVYVLDFGKSTFSRSFSTCKSHICAYAYAG